MLTTSFVKLTIDVTPTPFLFLLLPLDAAGFNAAAIWETTWKGGGQQEQRTITNQELLLIKSLSTDSHQR